MSANGDMHFRGYTVRAANQEHLGLAKLWTAADPDHDGVLSPQFWLEQRAGVDSTLLLDSVGPVFFFKAALLLVREDPVLRAQIFIQFMPAKTEEDLERTRSGLIHGTAWFEQIMRISGVKEIFFDTRQAKLIAFCKKRLGFEIEQQRIPWLEPSTDWRRLRKRLDARAEPIGKMEGV
jgi:hypothetical protein